MRRKQYGFSLIELVVVLAIVSILSVIAIKLYSRQVRQGRRTDGINTLLSISLAQERYRASNTTYGTLAQVWGGVSTSSEGYYTIAISNNTATAYTITATAIGDQANDSSGATSCASLVFTLSNGAISKTPAACWPT